jgi:hypothetical protein
MAPIRDEDKTKEQLLDEKGYPAVTLAVREKTSPPILLAYQELWYVKFG